MCGQLRIAMLPNPNQQGAGGIGAGPHLRPVEALKPSFSLSFDNSPTELSTWLSQFKSYFEALSSPCSKQYLLKLVKLHEMSYIFIENNEN